MPLEVTIPHTMQIVNERPIAVDVTLRGTAGSMWLVQQIACVVDLRSAREGEHIVPLTPENIRFPRAAGLEIVGIRPARILIDLEAIVTKEVPVAVATRGDPPPGYDVYAKYSEPARIMISGPRTRVERISEISTESVTLSDRKETLRIPTFLNIKDPMVHSDPVGPVTVSIEIGVHRKTVTVAKVAVSAGPEYSVSPAHISVQLLVPPDLPHKFTAADLSATLPAMGSDPAQSSRKVKPEVRLVNTPNAAISIKELLPAEVSVRKKEKS